MNVAGGFDAELLGLSAWSLSSICQAFDSLMVTARISPHGLRKGHSECFCCSDRAAFRNTVDLLLAFE
jgi:hypothetical protein